MMAVVHIDHLYNDNYIKEGTKIFVDPNEFGSDKLVISLVSNRCIKAKSKDKEFDLDPLRTFLYDWDTKKTKLLPISKNKYKIIYSVVMDGTYAEEIEADSDTEAINIFKSMRTITSRPNGEHLKNIEVICIKVKETFVRKVIL